PFDRLADHTPDAPTFASQSGVTPSSTVTSATVTLAGLTTPTGIKVSNGSYAINGGAYTSAPGAVRSGDTISLRHTASAANLTTTTTAVTIGGVVANFSSTTVDVPAQPAAPTVTLAGNIATVSFTAPADNGSAITGYTVSTSPAGGTDLEAGTTATTHHIVGLAVGTAYSFSVVAANAVGSSAASSASSTSTPASFAGESFGSLAGANTNINATAVDSAGNAYVTGTFNGTTLTLGATTLTKIGAQDAFVAKFNAGGTALWAKNYGGGGAYTVARGIAVDGSGNVYLGGQFGSANLTAPALTRIGSQDAFALKLDANGTTTWAKNYGGSGATASATGIAVDASGNVYLGGFFYSANLSTPALTRIGGSDTFAFKLDANGATTWARNYGGSGADAYAYAIAVDASGNVYLGGSFESASLTTPALTRIGNFDAFALKLDASGTTTWAKNYGGSGANSSANALAVDASGNVYLGGYFYNANLTSPALTMIGAQDAFAFKLDAGGATTWARNYGGSGATAQANGIALDASGNVYLGGYFSNANLTTPALTRIGGRDAFALKLDAGGTTTWAKNYGGSAAWAYANAIAADASGKVYLGGFFNGANLTTPALTRIGNYDAFLLKDSTPVPAPVSNYYPPAPTLINAPANTQTTLSGTTPVNAAAGSTLVIPVGASVAGTPISLPTPVVGAKPEPVTIKIGGQTLTVTPTGAGTVVTLKKIAIDGVETPVLAVTNGSVTVSAPAGQPLLALSNGVTVTAGDQGGTVSSSGNTLAVTDGTIILPANAFAASHGFASIKDGKVYAGEVADLDAAGKVTSVRLGSLAKNGSALGDPIQPAGAANLEDLAIVPSLKGKIARLSASRDYTDLLAASMGQGIAAQGQNSDGVLRLTIPGGTLNALPVGDLTVDTSRPDGITLTANGQAEIVQSGVLATFVPSVADLARCAAQLAQLDPDAVLSIQADGRMRIHLNRTTYALQPAWTSNEVTGSPAATGGFSTDQQGNVTYQDNATRQTLYPAFADQPQLSAALKALDPAATLAAKGDGSYSIELLGQSYTLTPDYPLTPAPTEKAGKSWWQDATGKLYLRNGDGSAQGFAVR
ncbi:MAG: SBBP repeat-containing protein, partial [Sulfuricella sp.]|nr:SBBP repeat-containing protein [Sulfuricella sp.]